MRHLIQLSALMAALTASPALAGPSMLLPEVSLGSVPYQSFSGELCETASDIITVPDDQDFIVTMVSSNADGHTSRAGDWENGAMLMRDSEIALAGNTIADNSTLPIHQGQGRLPVHAGSTLSIKALGTGGTCGSYYLQGYMIQTGSPYRSYFGSSALGRTVVTVDGDRQFLVRTIALSSRESPGYCHMWIDGVKTPQGSRYLLTDRGTYDGGNSSGFATGKGTLVLPGGSTVTVGPEDDAAATQCDYYIAGEYLQP
jgi:hypothetical protein